MDEKQSERFVSGVKIAGPTECWEWQRYRRTVKNKNYGEMKVSRISKLTHRLAYELWVGPITRGLWVLHKCDNPPCCNPNHLFLGTGADNMADKVAKGRARGNTFSKGEKNHKAKLTEKQVLEIRYYAERDVSSKALAERYGISVGYVGNLIRRRRWKHV